MAKDIELDGMPRGILPAIVDGELRAAAFTAEGAEVEVRWDLSKITARQAERLALEFSELATRQAAVAELAKAPDVAPPDDGPRVHDVAYGRFRWACAEHQAKGNRYVHRELAEAGLAVHLADFHRDARPVVES